jgi:hypothetical protein
MRWYKHNLELYIQCFDNMYHLFYVQIGPAYIEVMLVHQYSILNSFYYPFLWVWSKGENGK